MVREAVTNVVRHSEAQTCTVSVTADAVSVADDGIGVVRSDAGSGLNGLAARVAAAGGALEVHAEPGAGTRVTARISAATTAVAAAAKAVSIPGDTPRAPRVGSMIRLVLVDDQAMVRQALAALLELEPDLTVVGQAGGSVAAVQLVESVQPDVVLMDVQLGPDETGGDGLAATATIMTAHPATRVIILTTFGRPGYLSRALAAGAVGFMVKDAPAHQLVEAVRRVNRGLRVVDPELATDSLILGISPLTDRETEVLRAAAGGAATGAIADQVSLSEGTVRNHLSAAIGKLGAANRAEAVQIATDNGWLS